MLRRASPLPHQLLWRPPTPYPERDMEDPAVNLVEPPAALPAPYLIPGPAVIHEEEPQVAPLDLTTPPIVIDISDDEDDEPQAQSQDPAAAVAYWPPWHHPEPQHEPIDLRERIDQLRAVREGAPQPPRLQPWRSQAPASGRVAIVIPLPKNK
ncbi:uncharacterized protein LOC113215824 [Frankliniella occidentalis]|uniref:Uncharacterized protein LOC113215824 n=1 Tax=Frankliniella occidentalis TaxID=133901 RepID=A0A9C6X9R0_FRAOC|nr:uncharacterized protein LOC113215824 [Frankliniella occidentalis]